jgi:hypothetical protein
MVKNQVLFISFWNPTEKQPQNGIFIHEQAAAICNIHNNVIFMQVNVLPSLNIFLNKTIYESDYHNNVQITVNLHSRFWKFYYVNPWILARILSRILKKLSTRVNPSIIHANVIHPCGIVGYLLSRKMGSKLIISEHWSRSGKFLSHPFYKYIAIKA